jgi:hypothetical protein
MVTTSSTEAELLALVDGVKKSLPLLKILGDIGFKAHMKVWQDNQSTIQIAHKGEGFGAKAKHFRVRHDFLKDLIKEATIIAAQKICSPIFLPSLWPALIFSDKCQELCAKKVKHT